MAGRIFGLAVATIAGVSITVATLGPELKEQRRNRLEEEYKSDIGAVAAAREAASLSPPEPAQQPEPLKPASPVTSEESKPSMLSSMLGLWAWKKKSDSDSSSANKN